MEQKYEKIRQFVKRELSSSAHDMEHVMRVYDLCMHLANYEANVDLDVLKTAVLLHDIARVKEDDDDSGRTDHAALGAKMAERILRDLNYSEEAIEKIKHCITAHRFKSGNEPKTMEAKILFDADKLDAIGAIGIARSYMIAGQYGEKIYSDVPLEEYIKDNLVNGERTGRIKQISRHAPNIEYETKFKHIPQKLYTQRAKAIAKERLKFMKMFFERLEREMTAEI